MQMATNRGGDRKKLVTFSRVPTYLPTCHGFHALFFGVPLEGSTFFQKKKSSWRVLHQVPQLTKYRRGVGPTSIHVSTSIHFWSASQSISTTSDVPRRWPVGKPRAGAFQRAIYEEHPGSLRSIAKRAKKGSKWKHGSKWDPPPVWV